MNPNIFQHYEFYNYQYPPYRQFILAPIGSWNYDCADEYSDTDTKAIILPTIEDVIQNKCDSFTHIFPNEEHFDATDIRNFLKSLQKGNPQFIEVLFSKWLYANNKYYGEEIHDLMGLREDIARCNPSNTMRAMLGMADRNFNLCQQRASEDHANKWLYQLMRIEEQMKKYMLGEKFADCLITDKREDLLYVKNGQWREDEVKSFAKQVILQCSAHYNVFKETYEAHEDIWTQKRVQQIITQVCRKSLNEVTK